MLAKLFIRNYRDTKDERVRRAYGKLSGIVGIVCNLLLFAGKFVVGMLTGSIAIQADAFNNLSDAASSIAGFVGFTMAGRPADHDHPYGHARYEYIAGLVVCFLVITVGLELFKSSLSKIITPEEVSFSWASVIVLSVSMLVKLWLCIFNRKCGKAISSETLLATSADSRNDVITTGAVLIGVCVEHFASVSVDGWLGLAVAAFILYNGVGMIRSTLDPILGKAPDKETVEHIREKILSYEGVLGTHDLMVHDYGPGRKFASVHVEMAAETDPLISHEVIDTIERDFMDEGLHMVIHYDPVSTKDTELSEIREWLAATVREVDPDLAIHDLRMVKGAQHTKLIFDCVHSPECKYTPGELRQQIQRKVSEKRQDLICVVTIESGYVSAE
ncbi:MAG: cation diffusion facilitator family transporter [Christensenellaceae bacterium]